MTSLTTIILGLSIAYTVLGVLLLGACVYTRLPLAVKAGAILVTSAFYVVSFFGTRALLGWSSVDPLPAHFKLLGARIVEPHSLAGDPGAIHLWVEALDDDNRPSGVPRAYRLPYTAKLAEKTEAAVQASAERQAAGRRSHGGFRHRRGRYRGADGARSHPELDHHHQRRRSFLRRSARPGVCARSQRRHRVFAARAAAHAAQGRALTLTSPRKRPDMRFAEGAATSPQGRRSDVRS